MSCVTQRHPLSVLVSGISGHGNVLCDMSCDTVLACPGCGHPVLGVGQQQVEKQKHGS